MARSAFSNVFFYFRGPSTRDADGDGTARQVEDNTTKALINVLEHSEPAVLAAWLDAIGLTATRDLKPSFYVQGGPTHVEAPIRRLAIITSGAGAEHAVWQASTAEKGRVDAAVYVPGELLVVIEAKVGAALDAGQLDKHAADWGIERAREFSPAGVPTSWVFTTWSEMHRWALGQADEPATGAVSRFLLAQFAEYLELINVTPFAGFRDDDFAFLADRRAGGPTTAQVSDPLEGARVKDRLWKLWLSLRDRLSEEQQKAFGAIHAGSLRAVDDRVAVQTNRDQRDAVNLTFELDPDRLELNMVAWTAPQTARFEAWLRTTESGLSHLDGWELVMWKRRAVRAASGRPFWQREEREELARSPVSTLANPAAFVDRHRATLQAGWEQPGYHLRRSWPRDQVIAAGAAIANNAAQALQQIMPLLASVNATDTALPASEEPDTSLDTVEVDPVTLTDMGFVLGPDCDHTLNEWKFIAAGMPFITISPNGMHLRGIRYCVAALEDLPDKQRFVACALTKSYASGGKTGSLDVISPVGNLEQAVSRANRALEAQLKEDEIYDASLQPSEPATLEQRAVELAVSGNRALFIGDWRQIDSTAEHQYIGSHVQWALSAGPITLTVTYP